MAEHKILSMFIRVCRRKNVFCLFEKFFGLLEIFNLFEFLNYSMPERLGQLFREGLLKAAETTGAWIIT